MFMERRLLGTLLVIVLVLPSLSAVTAPIGETCEPTDKLCPRDENPTLPGRVLTPADARSEGIALAADGGGNGTADDHRADQGRNASEDHRRDDEHRPGVPPNGTGEREQVPCSDETPPHTGCPDLTVDPNRMLQGRIVTQTFDEEDCNVIEGHVPAGERRLLRFTYTTPNLGEGDLIVGAPANHTEWFEWSDCHEHYHYKEYADYRLWTKDGYAMWQAARATMPDAPPEEVFDEHPELEEAFVAGHKQGFCVIDIRGYFATEGPHYRSCSDNQGITVRWADEYHFSLDGQWVDITNVTAGEYVLEAETNPERLFEETSYANNAGAVLVQIPES